MPEEYQTNPAIFPPDEAVAASETVAYLGEDVVQMREELCTKINAA
jgi:hypothetical protein